jgi:hypothetical protein
MKNNSSSNMKRTSLKELYKLADSLKKVRNKGRATTMWVDDRPISNERYRLESKTMWIEDSVINERKNFLKKERGFTRKK